MPWIYLPRCHLPLLMKKDKCALDLAAARSADGVIAGSALIRCIREAPSREAAVDRVRALLEDMGAAMEGLDEEERAP